MNQSEIIKKTAEFVQSRLKNEASGHDWWHIYRVWNLAKYIAKQESADMFIVELTALLHDIADWKLHNGDIHAGPSVARNWLKELNVSNDTIDAVCNIILNMSYKGSGVKSDLLSLEGRIVQDADRLDAIGAIGVARTFAFGGAFSQSMHDPEIPITQHNTFEEYKNKKTTSVNHFYEKLLLLKDRMNTESAKKIAESRHQFMENFLQQFLHEWDRNLLSE